MIKLVSFLLIFCTGMLFTACGETTASEPPMEYPESPELPPENPDDPDVEIKDINSTVTAEAIIKGSQWEPQVKEQWFIKAEQDIEKNRRGDMTITVLDASGLPIPDAQVTATMKQHEFNFGGALAPEDLRDSPVKKQKVLDLFNMITFGNAMKWRNDEASMPYTVPVLDWLVENGIKVRGHALIWGAWKNMPDGFEAKYGNNAAALKTVMDERINTKVPFWGDRIYEWDVFNEPSGSYDAMDLCGWGIMDEYLKRVRELEPNIKLYINEYGYLWGATNEKHWTWLNDLLSGFKNNGTPLDGLGIQLYPKAKLDMPSIVANFDRLAQTGLELKITEYGHQQAPENMSDEIKGENYFNVLHAAFANKANTGVIWWGAIGGIIKQNNELTPMGEILAYLAFHKWRTNAKGKTTSDGVFKTRGYYGEYEITVTANGKTKTVPIKLATGGETNFEIRMNE